MKTSEKDIDRISIYLPKELAEKIRKAAAEDRRSLSSFVANILDDQLTW